MGGTLFIFLLTITHVSLLLNSVIAVNPKKGFSLKMMHIDSKASPLYAGDHLTREERLQRLVKQSKARARYIESRISLQSNPPCSKNPDVVRLPVVYEPQMYYVAMVGLGTFPDRQPSFMEYYLVIDSGSDDTWLQCEKSTIFFNQSMPLYPWPLSTTYRPVLCTDPRCKGYCCNVDNECYYESRYMSGAVSLGVAAMERFTVHSATGGLENIDLLMGCGQQQANFRGVFGDNGSVGKPNLIAGILGLGGGPKSFLNQLGDDGEGRFSYCFETFNKNIDGSDTYLRFGADATIGGQGQEVRKTPIVAGPATSLYYLNLEDISVGNRRAKFPRRTFEINSAGEGGSIIDSGSVLSVMYSDHFDRVADLVKAHFDALGVEYVGSQDDYEVCFRLRGKFDINNYPSITLHFQQANYVISDYKANFLMLSNDTVCLGILRRDTNKPAFILGAMQQTNKRILYDVMDQSLSFATEYCELGS